MIKDRNPGMEQAGGVRRGNDTTGRSFAWKEYEW